MEHTPNDSTDQGQNPPPRARRSPPDPNRPPPDPNQPVVPTRARRAPRPPARPIQNIETEEGTPPESPDMASTPIPPRAARQRRAPRPPRPTPPTPEGTETDFIPPEFAPEAPQPPPPQAIEPEPVPAIAPKQKKRKPKMPPPPVVEVGESDDDEETTDPVEAPNTENFEKLVLNIALILFTNIAISFFHIISIALMEAKNNSYATGTTGIFLALGSAILPIVLANLTARSLLKYAYPQLAMPSLWNWATTIIFFVHFCPHLLNAVGFNIWYARNFF